MATERRRHSRPAGSPARVEASPDGGVRVDVDAVTPREVHALLDPIRDRQSTLELSVEKRLGRVEKLVLALVIVTASPKLGGPSLPKVADGAVQGALQLAAQFLS